MTVNWKEVEEAWIKQYEERMTTRRGTGTTLDVIRYLLLRIERDAKELKELVGVKEGAYDK